MRGCCTCWTGIPPWWLSKCLYSLSLPVSYSLMCSPPLCQISKNHCSFSYMLLSSLNQIPKDGDKIIWEGKYHCAIYHYIVCVCYKVKSFLIWCMFFYFIHAEINLSWKWVMLCIYLTVDKAGTQLSVDKKFILIELPYLIRILRVAKTFRSS